MSAERGVVTRVSYWPTGCNPQDADDPNAGSFRVDVEWMGPRYGDEPRAMGGYRVVLRGVVQLSRGGKWDLYVPRYRLWQYRWATIEEAQAVAERHVDSAKVNGRTWAEWEAYHARAETR